MGSLFEHPACCRRNSSDVESQVQAQSFNDAFARFA
jgi:hypothetical protein